jgi:hypothetical protein
VKYILARREYKVIQLNIKFVHINPNIELNYG